jgi:hypothetical protein
MMLSFLSYPNYAAFPVKSVSEQSAVLEELVRMLTGLWVSSHLTLGFADKSADTSHHPVPSSG